MKVFISYAHKDPSAEVAHKLYQLLHGSLGVDCFLDEGEIAAAQEFRRKIHANINLATHFVAFLSNTYLKRSWCLRELDQALKQRRRTAIVPVCVSPLEKISRRLWWTEYADRLQHIQVFDFAKYEHQPLLHLAHVLCSPNGPARLNGEPERAGACPYLKRYVQQAEPSLLDPGSTREIGYRRGYELLVYMFDYEKFEEVAAFDLAAHRWEELFSEDTQAINISREIFKNIWEMFQENRCRRFRRILVIREEKLASDLFRQMVGKFCSFEAKCRKSGFKMETKVFVWGGNTRYGDAFKKLCDFISFRGKDGAFSLVETTQREPDLDPRLRLMKVESMDQKAFDWRWKEFNGFWERSTPIKDFQAGVRNGRRR